MGTIKQAKKSSESGCYICSMLLFSLDSRPDDRKKPKRGTNPKRKKIAQDTSLEDQAITLVYDQGGLVCRAGSIISSKLDLDYSPCKPHDIERHK
jgi:hypothetical protein